MIERDYFSHTIPGYGKVWDKLEAVGYCYQRRRREHRLEQLPRRHRDGRDPRHVHELRRPPREHHGQGLGPHRGRRLQGRRRQEDVDRPVRRQVRAAATPEADRQAHPEADRQADPEAHAEARRAKPTAKPAARSTPRPTPRPTPRKTATPEKATPEPPQADTGGRRDPRSARDRSARRWRTSSASTTASEPEPTDDDGSTDSTETAKPANPVDDTEGDGAVGMRVVDDGGTDGLLQSIVGGVAGLFFGG